MSFGDAPVGRWQATPLEQLCTVQTGPSQVGGPEARLPTGPGGVPLVRPRDLRDRRVSSSVGAVSPHAAIRLDRYRLEAGDVLVTRTGTVGRVALISPAEADWLYSGHLVRLRPRTDALQSVTPGYLVSYLESPQVRDWLLARARMSTAVPYISARQLGQLPISVPPAGIQQEIGRQLAILDDKIRVHRQIAETTAELRATLAALLLDSDTSAPGGRAPGAHGSGS